MTEVRIPISQQTVSAGNGSACTIASSRSPCCKRLKVYELALRGAAAVTCIVAFIVMITDQQTKVISVPGFSGLAITKTAKYNLAEAFVYLISAAGIGAGYAISVITFSLFCGRPSRGSKTAWFIFVFDQLVTYVLLGAAAASTEVAYLGAHASPEAAWLKVCTIFGRFCNQLGASLISSFLATVIFAITINISAYHVFNGRSEIDMPKPLKG